MAEDIPAPAPPPGHADWTGWTCDDLVPDLCELDEPQKGFVTANGMKVRYWRYKAREGAAGASDNFPIVVVHGGPAQSHDYLLALKQQACRGRDVIFYDQAGCGRSDWPTVDADLSKDYPWLVDIKYYANVELPRLIDHLKLEKYHIFGHSWGTVIAQTFALDASPEGLVSMILSGPMSDAQGYNAAQLDPETGTVNMLPPFISKRLVELEEKKAYTSEEYLGINGLISIFFTSWTAGTRIIPNCVRDTFDKTNWVLYKTLWGPSEIRIAESATLFNFNVTERLKEINVPILLTSAKYDLMTPKVLQPLKENLPHAEYLMLKRSSHASMVDEPGPMNDATADFLTRMETLGIAGLKPQAPPAPPLKVTKEICAKFDFDSGKHTVSTVLLLAGSLGSFMIGALFGSMSSSKKAKQD